MTDFIDHIRQKIQDPDLLQGELVQSLWSGYGEIRRFFSPKLNKHLVVKHVLPPEQMRHPMGWNSDVSHQRKLRSYEVEQKFYREYSLKCNEDCYVPSLYHSTDSAASGESIIVMEDLDKSGYSLRKTRADEDDVFTVIRWLAAFHGTFLNVDGEELWEQGGYWHLDTRPDEWQVMSKGPLKEAAASIDVKIKSCRHSTLIHGDAKLANYCFHAKDSRVAGVDFQYIGIGPGVKDLMLFLGSCLNDEQLFELNDDYLDYYFQQLQRHVPDTFTKDQFLELEKEWRKLYPFVWADFHRFLQGWSPDHFKINGFMQLQTEITLQLLAPSSLSPGDLEIAIQRVPSMNPVSNPKPDLSSK